MKNRVIFLDFDGVINHINTKAKCKTEYGIDLYIKVTDKFIGDFSTDNLKIMYLLFNFCVDNNIKIVISSAWRVTVTPKQFDLFFKELFFILYKEDIIIGATKNDDKIRELQILDYVKENDIDKYLVIDDEILVDNKVLEKEVVLKTETNIGFTYEHFLAVKKFFLTD